MMLQFSKSFSKLLVELKKLPGVGERTALRLAFHLLKSPARAATLAESLIEVTDRVGFCSTCFAITEEDPCCICSGNRDRTKICVVEEPQDLFAIERSHAFSGLYHVLQGALSPVNGVTPADLKIEALLSRLRDGEVQEVVIATNFSVEGEATALYLTRLIKPLGIRTTRLAHGIPLGSELEYVDAATVQRALQGRNDV
jgi:recombination protein RecR